MGRLTRAVARGSLNDEVEASAVEVSDGVALGGWICVEAVCDGVGFAKVEVALCVVVVALCVVVTGGAGLGPCLIAFLMARSYRLFAAYFRVNCQL